MTFLIILIITTKEIIGNFTAKYQNKNSYTWKPAVASMWGKKCNHSGAHHQYFLIFFQIEISYLALEHWKDTLTLNISGKEFHVIIPLCRTQCFVLDLFKRGKMLIWLLVLVLWLWIWLLISKLDFISSSIFECNIWET